MHVPYNKPYIADKAIPYIKKALGSGHLEGDGPFTDQCHSWLENQIKCDKALLTHSGTAALEMAAILCDIKPGDEIIMPSFTFVTTATAFVLRGGVPVFVDIRTDTKNIDETKIEEAVTSRTRVIVPVHYAGVPCEMDRIMDIAARNDLLVVEDTAMGILSSYKGTPLGRFGQFAALSFHQAKNVTSGEGGALLINDPGGIERAEFIREKGTTSSAFDRGTASACSWVDIGSSYSPSEITSAFLLAQMETADLNMTMRAAIWRRYHEAFADLEETGLVERPIVPAGCCHNANIYYLLLPDAHRRQIFIERLGRDGVIAKPHYSPLHFSPAGERFGRVSGDMCVTHSVGDRLVRLPLWAEMSEAEVGHVIEAVHQALRKS